MNELSFPSDRMRSPSSQNSVARRTSGTWGAVDFRSLHCRVLMVSKLFIMVVRAAPPRGDTETYPAFSLYFLAIIIVDDLTAPSGSSKRGYN